MGTITWRESLSILPTAALPLIGETPTGFLIRQVLHV